jgi:hypothetical protein
MHNHACLVCCVLCALQSGCLGGGNPPKPPKGLFGKTGNDTKNRCGCRFFPFAACAGAPQLKCSAQEVTPHTTAFVLVQPACVAAFLADIACRMSLLHELRWQYVALCPMYYRRVDQYGADVDGSTTKEGCASRTLFMASNGLLCPRWV